MSNFNEEARPAIGADLRRRVLIEAGHRCAIPTCRHIEVDIHHIVPWSQCQTHDYDNLIAICPNCHRRADRGEIDRKSLRIYKSNLRFAHDKFSQLEMDVLFQLALTDKNEGIPWLAYMMVLLKRLSDAGYVGLYQIGAGMTVSGIKTTPDIIYITDKGREFVSSLGVDEL